MLCIVCSFTQVIDLFVLFVFQIFEGVCGVLSKIAVLRIYLELDPSFVMGRNRLIPIGEIPSLLSKSRALLY